MNNIGYAIRDFIVFGLILIITEYVLSELRYDINVYRNTVEIIAVIFLFASTFIYVFLVNKKYLLSIVYSLTIFLILLFLSDKRIFPTYWFFLLIIISISFFFYVLKTFHKENSVSKNVNKLKLSEFIKIGYLKGQINTEFFQINKEMNVDKGCYKKFKPLLINKSTNNTNDLVLNYTNKDDLNFTLLIMEDNQVYINHKKNKTYSNKINKCIMQYLKNIC